MSLEVWTARISSKDPDRFDITRKSGGLSGVIFAPSWAILRPALDSMKAGDAAAWSRYVPAYLEEMRESYKVKRAGWEGLLSRARVVLVCYCVDPLHCHRTLLGRDILPRLGAAYRGEVAS